MALIPAVPSVIQRTWQKECAGKTTQKPGKPFLESDHQMSDATVTFLCIPKGTEIAFLASKLYLKSSVRF